MRKICWLCWDMSKSDEKFITDSLDRLASNLRKPPVEIELAIEKLSESQAATICSQVSKAGGFADASSCVAEEIYDDTSSRQAGFVPGLLIYCQKEHPLAQSARAENPSAEWGATCGRLAVVWTRGNEKLIWHEALHLLGATDCYDKETLEGKCEKEPGCLMQYAPTDETVAKWPDCLCLGTVDRLRSPDSAQRRNGQIRRNYIRKYRNSESGLYRYSRYDCTVFGHSEEKDHPLGRPIKNVVAWHSKPVPRETSFEPASANSASFRMFSGDRKDLPRGVHTDLMREDGKSWVAQYDVRFKDGTSITRWYESSCQINMNPRGKTGRKRKKPG